MERTIHRAWYWTFLKAYVICYLFGVVAVMAGIPLRLFGRRQTELNPEETSL